MKREKDYLKLIWDADKDKPEPESLGGLLYFMEKGFYAIMASLIFCFFAIMWWYFV